MIPENKTVLDIGGQLNMLSQFCKGAKIIVANLESSQEKSDITIKKNSLPFAANSFDIVTAIDVLEHIPKNERKDFINKLGKVAREKVILSFPIGTSAHSAYEREMEKWLKARGHDIDYLKEHIKYGLPKTKEIKNITSGLKTKIFFSGNLKVNKMLFKIFLFDPKIFIVRRLVFFAKNFFYFLTNHFLYTILSGKNFSENVVRAYLIINKK